jgi:dipeptidyl-peptidase-4
VVRYLGLPTPDDNLAGYQASDVTSKAKKLDGKKFLIVHGTAGMSLAPAGAWKKNN